MIYEKLIAVQNELKVPKEEYSSFGNYNYRKCEDILENLKPLLLKNKLTLILNDEIELIGSRYYIKATAKLIDIESDGVIEVKAYAREAEEKPKMDSSQVTGSASSYARKYALNGMFCIDDTKDSDYLSDYSGNNKTSSVTQKPNNEYKQQSRNNLSEDQEKQNILNEINILIAQRKITSDFIDKLLVNYFKKERIEDLSINQFRILSKKVETETKKK